MKRLLSGVLSILIVVSMVLSTSAFSSKNTQTNGAKKWFHKYTKEITLSRNAITVADEKFAAGDSAENNTYTRWAKKEMGIVYKQKWVVPDASTDIQKLNLAMASNDLPDIIDIQSGDMFSKMVQAGMLKPINKLIDQYGSPLTKYMVNAYQKELGGNFFSLFTVKGNSYAFPQAADVFAANWNNLWMRKDVLDSLGKQVPKTLAQFEDILAAYKAKNPEGVGFVLDTPASTPIMNSFGAFPGKWIKDKSGSLTYGSIQPEVKKGLATLNKWYKNGWLDKEFFVKDDGKAKEPFIAGNGLSVYGQWWYMFWPFPDLWKNVPKAEMVPVAPLTGPTGKQSIMYDMNNGYYNGGRAISAKCKNPEALIYMLNEHLDSTYRYDQTLRTMMKKNYNYDFKYPYEKVKDPINPNAKPEEQKWNYKKEGPGVFFNVYQGNPVHHFFGFRFNQAPLELFDTYMKMSSAIKRNTVNKLKDEDMNAYQTYKGFDTNKQGLSSLLKNLDMFNSLKQQKGLIVYNQFTSAPTKTMIDKGAYLNKLESETFTKIIIGDKPIDEFDRFVADWKKAGGNDITKEVNVWSSANKK